MSDRPKPSRQELNAMALDQSALLELLEMMRSADDGELMRRLLATMMQAVVDAEATAFIGAEPHSGPRPAQRGATTPATRRSPRPPGDLRLKIPKVRTGSFFGEFARAAPADRRRAAPGGDAGLRRRRQHQKGGRPGRRARRQRDQQERGLPDLPQTRRRGRRVAGPIAYRSRHPNGGARVSCQQMTGGHVRDETTIRVYERPNPPTPPHMSDSG